LIILQKVIILQEEEREKDNSTKFNFKKFYKVITLYYNDYKKNVQKFLLIIILRTNIYIILLTFVFLVTEYI